jgi:hypothetical protein
LTKSEEKDTIIINRSGRSTYPEEKSVQTSGATPVLNQQAANFAGGDDGWASGVASLIKHQVLVGQN